MSQRFDSTGRTIWIADARRGGKRFVVHADELLSAFLELEAAIPTFRSFPVPTLISPQDLASK